MIDAAVLKESADDRSDPDVFRQTRHARSQCTHATHDQVDFHTGLAGLVERLDDLRFEQGIDLGSDVGLAPGAGDLGLAVNRSQDVIGEGEWRLQQAAQVDCMPGSGQAAKDLMHIGADIGIRGEQAEVFIQARRARMVVTGSEVRIALEGTALAAQQQGQLGMGLVADHPVDHMGTDFFETTCPVDVGFFIEAGHQLDHHRNLLAGTRGSHQRLHQRGIGPGPVDGLLDRHHVGIGGRTAQEVHHRHERLIRVMQQDVLTRDRTKSISIRKCRRQTGLEGRKLQIGPIHQVDHLLQAHQIHRAFDAIAILLGQIELSLEEFEYPFAHRGRHFQPDFITVLALGQLGVQGLTQIGDVVFIEEKLAIARDPELIHRTQRQPGKKAINKTADDRGQQHQSVGRVGHFLGNLEHSRQRAWRLHDGDVGLAPERIGAVEFDHEVQRLVQDARKRMGRIKRNRREQRLDLIDEDFLGPGALGFVPVGTEQDFDTLCGQGREHDFVEQLVLMGHQTTRPARHRSQGLGYRTGIQLGVWVDPHELLELGHPHLEEFVEVVADDGQVAQPLEQRDGGVLGLSEHPLIEGENAEFAVEQPQ